ncbi:MAG: hypothetical protein HYY62_00920 [Deltaproteobacteria bacterium]|nr:hypothetical protein [Deltaproteobacteria bacterium]
MILKISILALLLFSACGSEENNAEPKQELLLDLEYPEAFMTLGVSGKKRFEEEVAFYQFTFGGKTTDLIDRRDYRRYVFNDIPLDEQLTIHVGAFNFSKKRVCHGEETVHYSAGGPTYVAISLTCP